MRKVVLSIFTTLDGVTEGPDQWQPPFWGEEMDSQAYETLFASDALLLGRKTYEGFAEAWPTITDEVGFADRMNSLPKYVASTTISDLAWNNSHLLDGNLVDAVTELKRQDGENILIYGSAALADTLRRHGLIDEYQIWVHPVVVGEGNRLFKEGTEQSTLRLVDAKKLGPHVVLLTYRPASD